MPVVTVADFFDAQVAGVNCVYLFLMHHFPQGPGQANCQSIHTMYVRDYDSRQGSLEAGAAWAQDLARNPSIPSAKLLGFRRAA